MGQRISRLLGRKSTTNDNAQDGISSDRQQDTTGQGQIEAEEKDIIIAVVGPTGSGKSTFVDRVSGRETKGVSHGLKSHTKDVNPFRFRDQQSGRFIVLVDTPGFNNTSMSDTNVLNMISDWLSKSYKRDKLLSAILYLHQITDNRMAGTPLKNFHMFQKLCGSNPLDKVYLITTMWDEVEKSDGRTRLEELKSEYWKKMVDQGSHVVCCSDDKSAKELVQDILKNEDGRGVLFPEETGSIVETEETATEQQPHSWQVEKLIRRQTEILGRIKKTEKAGSDPRLSSKLKQEYVELGRQINDMLGQMREPKSPL